MKGIQNMKEFSKSIKYIGADDKDLDLFESQYIIPNGVSYNSYVVMDEKIAVMDTVDARKTNEWLANLEAALGGRHPDYLVISHLELPIPAFAQRKSLSESANLKRVRTLRAITANTPPAAI